MFPVILAIVVVRGSPLQVRIFNLSLYPLKEACHPYLLKLITA